MLCSASTSVLFHDHVTLCKALDSMIETAWFPLENSEMLSTALRTSLGLYVKISRRGYCKDIFDFLSRPVPVNTKTPELSSARKISKNLILHLEGTSLVNLGDERGIKILEDAISYADQLEEVNTDGIEPLFTVLENEFLYLREDAVQKDVKTNDLLSNAEKVFEGYYVVPVGNIAYVPDDVKPESVMIESENTQSKEILKN